MSSVNLRQLFEAGVHFGHQTRFREPRMSSYIYGVRNGISIINLEVTKPLLNQAINCAKKLGSESGGKVLFVGTKRAARVSVKDQAIRCGMPYVNHRWLGGTLTNYRTIRQSVKRLKELDLMSKDGTFNHLTKKEEGRLRREMDKLERSVGGIKDMNGIPDMLFIIDVGYEHIAVSEARKLKIPIIGVVDTNHSPEGVDFVIPGNDDASAAILLYATVMADAVLEGRTSKSSSAEFYTETTKTPETLSENTDEQAVRGE